MSRITTSLLAALAAGVLTTGILYYLQRTRAHEASRLRSENAHLRLRVSERHVARIAPSAPSTTATTSPAESQPVVLAPRELRAPEGDYRNEGQSSPLATLQTFAWACDLGDSETIKNLLCFEAAGRVKADAFMKTLPPEAQSRWTSPEAMAAELLTHNGMQQPFPVATILDRAIPEAMADGRVTLRLPGTPKDGTLYQKVGDRWHYVITEAAVDRYIADAAKRSASVH